MRILILVHVHCSFKVILDDLASIWTCTTFSIIMLLLC